MMPTTKIIKVQKRPRREHMGFLALRNALASTNRRPERVGIEAVIVAELKLGNVKRHIFAAHLVEHADNTAFEDQSESLNRVGVNCTNPGSTVSQVRR